VVAPQPPAVVGNSLHLGCNGRTHEIPLRGIEHGYDLKAGRQRVTREVIVMSAMRPVRAAIHAIRKVHDEQVLMWNVWYRTQVRPGAKPGANQPTPPRDRSSASKPDAGELAGRR
jgi:hypothetical protein